MLPVTPDELVIGPQQTTIQLDKEQVTVTQRDADGMRAALLEQLRASSLEERDYLIRMTERAPAWIDADGTIRIGAWVLQAGDGALTLVYRLQAGTAAIRTVNAILARSENGWKVIDIREGRITPRR